MTREPGLDKSQHLRIKAVGFGNRHCILPRVSPQKTKAEPRPRPVDPFHFDNPEIRWSNFAILPAPSRFQLSKTDLLSSRCGNSQWRQFLLELSPRVDLAHQDDSLRRHIERALRFCIESCKDEFWEKPPPRRPYVHVPPSCGPEDSLPRFRNEKP